VDFEIQLVAVFLLHLFGHDRGRAARASAAAATVKNFHFQHHFSPFKATAQHRVATLMTRVFGARDGELCPLS
jgi:hypothetical protein